MNELIFSHHTRPSFLSSSHVSSSLFLRHIPESTPSLPGDILRSLSPPSSSSNQNLRFNPTLSFQLIPSIPMGHFTF
ncbi:hypothetical protein QVD17_16061 [Tagetes erecta]|uniref:Uncharacterized protein n=1 Tax=Tagetes erecta TaxID=13708 RepID=A0AAD8KR11_TARER|nr:hypothetical protein QVD17_16061 [Tagetes erecta]